MLQWQYILIAPAVPGKGQGFTSLLCRVELRAGVVSISTGTGQPQGFVKLLLPPILVGGGGSGYK